ncbi:MAG: hypothetical protein GF411_15045 [Candidatus Lokiarchaeota archaeon]|nr:hypothetical protein [Candidatus Lokiarchaeota archaeon]
MKRATFFLVLSTLLASFIIVTSIYNTWKTDLEINSYVVSQSDGPGAQMDITADLIANHSYLVRVGFSDEGGSTAVADGYVTILLDGVEVKTEALYDYDYDDVDEDDHEPEASAFAQLYYWIYPASNQTLSIIGEKYRGDTWFFTLYEDMPEHLLGDRTLHALMLGSGMLLLVATFIGYVLVDIMNKQKEKEKEQEQKHDSELGVEYYE